MIICTICLRLAISPDKLWFPHRPKGLIWGFDGFREAGNDMGIQPISLGIQP